MGTQNLNNFYFNKLDTKINYSEYYDLFLASDEKDFNTDVVWSNGITSYGDGDVLPVWIDLNDTNCSTQPTTTCQFQHPTGNTPTYYINSGYRPFVVVSKNIWPEAKSMCDCPFDNYGYTASTLWFEICDIVYTGLDNGLLNYDTMPDGYCLYLVDSFSAGGWTGAKFDPHVYDKRLKMTQVKAFGHPTTGLTNQWYTDTSILNNFDSSGYYQDLRGGFYQGFYKLYGYPYEVLPTRPKKGWSFETYLKLNTIGNTLCDGGEGFINPCCQPVGDETLMCGENGNCYNTSGWNNINIITTATSVTFGFATNVCSPLTAPPNSLPQHLLNYSVAGLNVINVQNSNNGGFFFYKGIRAEDKYQNRGGLSADTQLDTLSACTTLSGGQFTTSGVTGCCNTVEKAVKLTNQNKSPDPRYDVYSNAFGVRLTDDMRIGYRTIRYTGECITTGDTRGIIPDTTYWEGGASGNTCNTGSSFSCGYTIEESYSDPICQFITQSGNCAETWIQVDVVFDRNLYLEDCEIYNNGGVNDLVKVRTDKFERYGSHVSNNGGPFGCHPTEYAQEVKPCKDQYPRFVEDAYFDFNCHGAQIQSWFNEKEYRLGTLTFYINGRRVHKVENYEEIIPRQLNTNKQTQVGVAYNMSWGGGALGLRESLIQQRPAPWDPCVLDGGGPNKTTFTNLDLTPDRRLISDNFAGSFVGGISQMMYYLKPLSADEIYHNFLINKDRYSLIDCEECKNCDSLCVDCDLPGAVNPQDTSPSLTYPLHTYIACNGGHNTVPGYIANGFPVIFISDSGGTPNYEADSEDYHQIIGSPEKGTVVKRSVVQNDGVTYLHQCYEYVGIQNFPIPDVGWTYLVIIAAPGGINELTVFPYTPPPAGGSSCGKCCSGCTGQLETPEPPPPPPPPPGPNACNWQSIVPTPGNCISRTFGGVYTNMFDATTDYFIDPANGNQNATFGSYYFEIPRNQPCPPIPECNGVVNGVTHMLHFLSIVNVTYLGLTQVFTGISSWSDVVSGLLAQGAPITTMMTYSQVLSIGVSITGVNSSPCTGCS